MRGLIVGAIVFATVVLPMTGVQANQHTAADQPPPYNVADFKSYAGHGDDQIVGRLVVNTKMFGPVTFAHAKIYLLPLSNFSVWFIRRLADGLANAERPEDYPAELTPFSRETTSDDNGYFSFSNLPEGGYVMNILTDYESDTDRIETRTVYTMTDDDWPSSFSTQHIRTKLRRELDLVAAKTEFTLPNERMQVTNFTILGSRTCCRGEI